MIFFSKKKINKRCDRLSLAALAKCWKDNHPNFGKFDSSSITFYTFLSFVFLIYFLFLKIGSSTSVLSATSAFATFVCYYLSYLITIGIATSTRFLLLFFLLYFWYFLLLFLLLTFFFFCLLFLLFMFLFFNFLLLKLSPWLLFRNWLESCLQSQELGMFSKHSSRIIFNYLLWLFF